MLAGETEANEKILWLGRGVSDADCTCESIAFAAYEDQGTLVTILPADTAPGGSSAPS
jgi:hypothetical protein